MTERVFAVLYFGGWIALGAWVAVGLALRDIHKWDWEDAVLWPLYAVRKSMVSVVHVPAFAIKVIRRAWRVVTFGEGTCG